MRRVASAALLATLIGCASAPPATPPEPAPTTTPSRQPTPRPTQLSPSVPPQPPLETAQPADELVGPLVRVLLVRSESAVQLPQPGRAYEVTTEGRSLWMWGPLSLRFEAPGTRWWQVGAWAERQAAEAAAGRLAAGLGRAVEVGRQTTAAGLTRVRVRWLEGEPGDPAAALAALGFAGSFAVPEAGRLRIEDGSGGVLGDAAEVVLQPAGDWPVAVGDRRYRGRLLARVVGRELLLVNELSMESYLRGVVPVEMGPAQFPELEALKAQAVAARTYAVAHLGDHADEGWDLCDTPACQAYWGFDAEHPLSNRAVRETAGVIAVFDGEPIDAMYSSTCGGHTEDAVYLFPGREQPYLRGVPCSWDRPIALVGLAADGPWLSATAVAASIAGELLGLPPAAPAHRVLERVSAATELETVELTAGSDLDLYADALLAAVGVDPPPGIDAGNRGTARLLFLSDLFEVPLEPPTEGLGSEWPAAAALAALELRGDLARDGGEAVPRAAGAGIFPRRAEHGEDLPTPLPLWECWGGACRRRSGVSVRPGTPLERLRAGERVLALMVRRSGGDGEADRRSAWREWVRELPWSEVESRLGLTDLERLTVTERSPSGRVVGLEATTADGRSKSWQGFDVRRALQLPETLFGLHLRRGDDGERVVRFLGRGWGHGVGLCQHGSYGLARSGMRFEQILKHYYTGIDVVLWSGAAAEVGKRAPGS